MKQWAPTQVVTIEMWCSFKSKNDKFEKIYAFELDLAPYLNSIDLKTTQTIEVSDDTVLLEAEELGMQLYVSFEIGPADFFPAIEAEDEMD